MCAKFPAEYCNEFENAAKYDSTSMNKMKSTSANVVSEQRLELHELKSAFKKK